MRDNTKRKLSWDFGISDMIEETPDNIEAVNTKVYPFVNQNHKTYMVRPEPSWSEESSSEKA